MSSTNRSKLRYEHDKDYYVTPKWCVREFLHAWDNETHELERLRLRDQSIILDPCAGGDPTNEMTYPSVLQEWGLNTVSLDIRPDSPCMFPGTDYLTADLTGMNADVVITNPPFNLALPIIQKSFEVVKPMGWIIMLLRQNFLGSQERGPWLSENMPHSLYTHSKRPGFYPDNWKTVMPWLKKKGTDSCEYAHFMWQKVSTNPYPYKGFLIPHVKGVSDAPGPFAT